MVMGNSRGGKNRQILFVRNIGRGGYGDIRLLFVMHHGGDGGGENVSTICYQ